jgi:peptidyl-prolyl cis-trans isomerase A (cyclophilin A)
MYEKESPKTVKNFQDLAMGRKAWTDPKTNQKVTKPLYNGLTFHRVIPGFMIQGGDPTGTGMGGTEVIPDEFDPSLTFDKPGKLAMANAGPGTGSCQFFITEGPTPHLNGRHTIFGLVIEGLEVVNKIANVPRGANDRPTTPQKIMKVSFQRVGPAPTATPATKSGTGTKSGTKATPKGATKAPAAKKSS